MCIQRGLGFPQQGQRPWLCISPVPGEEGKGSAGISDITPRPGPPPQPSLVPPQLLPGDGVGNSLLPAPPSWILGPTGAHPWGPSRSAGAHLWQIHGFPHLWEVLAVHSGTSPSSSRHTAARMETPPAVLNTPNTHRP